MAFYNQSNFDRINPAADISDDIAIAADKQALLPGQKASFANVTSYARGINGVMIDLFGIVGTPSAADFTFRVGTTGDPSKWAAGPAPSSILLRKGAGDGDSDRLAIAFPTGTIVNKWLQVTMKPTAVTGLGAPDVFYFGNLVGETGNVSAAATAATVDPRDLASVRNAMYATAVPVTNRYDFNRDGKVNALDLALARSNINDSLPLITAPTTAKVTAAATPGAASVLPATADTVPTRIRTSIRSELLFGSTPIA
jgi:hypothetical protein